MITLHLTRDTEADGVYLKLPSTPAEIGESFAELDAISTVDGPVRIPEAISNVYNLGSYLKNIDVTQPGELEKISTLARKMQTMDRESCFKFEGVLDANSVNSLDDILRLADSLDEYALLSDAADSSALGKYLVANDILSFPENIQPYLDFSVIGSEFYTEHGGAYCRAGYVVRKEELPELYQQEVREQECEGIVTLLLRKSGGGTKQPQPITISLPATDTAMEQAKRELGITEFAEANILTVDYTLPYFGTMLPQDCITVENANELALCIEEMKQTDGDILKYLSVVEVEKPETFPDALDLAKNLDDYERVPESYEDYGRMALERIGADEDIINEIDGYMDFESFGRAWMQEDKVVQTEFGMIRRLSEPFLAQEGGGMRLE